jgi:lipid-A-disaccharide synthase
MHIFMSAGEPSGDLHAGNLACELLRKNPTLRLTGFGGERMEAAGCELMYPLTKLAVMSIGPVLGHIPTFLHLVSRADRYFCKRRPDAVVLVDYPGLHWWLARRAHFRGIPVYYFVPPQLWGWLSYRVAKMRRWVDHVLCPLPFEPDWYSARGVRQAHYVGHPYFDELPQQRLDEDYLATERKRGGTIIGLLPGSRNQEVRANLSTMVRAASRVHSRLPDTRFLVAAYKERHRQEIIRYLKGRSLPIDVECGKTAEVIELSRACIAVSGSVGLELLYRQKPTAVLYRVTPAQMVVYRTAVTAPHISLVNLMAQKRLYPEYVSIRNESEAIAEQLLEWLTDRAAYEQITGELADLKSRTARPGACQRAAKYILETLTVGKRGARSGTRETDERMKAPFAAA